MNFAKKYFERFSSNEKIFSDNPRSDTGIIVVIPCYNEYKIDDTLNSIDLAHKPSCGVEVIVIVNSSENTPSDIVEHNKKVYTKLCNDAISGKYKNFKLQSHYIDNVPKKIAGVGNARKLGMDEAVRRFDYLNLPNAILVSLDADSLVSVDYLTSIEKIFNNSLDAVGAVFQFQHNYNDETVDNQTKKACKQYEMYLRYFRLSLKKIGVIESFHTIGSCLAVRALAYIKMGGMSKRQGGEDFYFLHKLAQLGKIEEVNEILVIPSPRISDRVPFGTGPAISEIIRNTEYKVYPYCLFLLFKEFYALLPVFYECENITLNNGLLDFIGEEQLKKIILECKKNTSNKSMFIKRIKQNFDVFFMIKFLNFSVSANKPPKQDITDAVKDLLSDYGKSFTGNADEMYNSILELDLEN